MRQESFRFDPIFLDTSGGQRVDLSRFEHGSTMLPGTWSTDIVVNDELVASEKLTFTEQPDHQVTVCITGDVLKKINLNYSSLPDGLNQALRNGEPCYDLVTLIPGTTLNYDSGDQKLEYSIPQAMMRNTPRGYVSPALWDAGIPAALMSYNASTYTTRSHGRDYSSSYVGLNGGVNLGPWQYRHSGNYSWQENVGSDYQSLENYVQRDLTSIMGRVRLGETTTGGQLFDTLSFRGIELLSDDRMQPQSRRGYAPDIRGIARTNARISIHQSGRLIYETTVSPGAFVIDDLYPSGYGGNLDVTVTEADGSVQRFQVPYASVTQLLRPGAHRYDVLAGKLNDPSVSFDPTLYQATYQRGLTNIFTGYGGVQGSGSDYYALMLGTAVSTPLGAFAADVTQARTHLKQSPGGASSGQSYQVSYSKYIPGTDSNLTIAAYRFSTAGYYDYRTAMQAIDEERQHRSISNIWRPKNRFNITLNQGLGDSMGQVYLTGYTQDYWNQSHSDLQYQAGYSNYIGRVSFNLSASRVRGVNGHMETNMLFNMSVPLGSYDGGNVPTLNAGMTRNSNGTVGQQAGISGTYGDDHQYNYGVTGSHYNKNVGSSVVLNSGWRSPYSHLSGSYGAGKNYQNLSLSASGTVIAWQNGVVATPYTGDTFAVVEAPGAKGAKVGGYPGIRVDGFGHAAIPYLNPYEMNEINLDPKGTSQGLEFNNTSDRVAPLSGAVSRVRFSTQQGIPLLIALRDAQNNPLPFGADVTDSSGVVVGSVGQMGQAYVRAEKREDTLTVKWGASTGQQCRFSYRTTKSDKTAFSKMNSTCR
ncbi:fimbria/pilus outer membrane usher protein [Raoultella ornithinolytica]|uniref:fimbria/pilus outer membrane usher protein n=1 Tax=Raoultella ornithinolytica TaxID=54291 RepID=UPI001F48F897|nr:fimbria/pilus outer membrane usher protein [Raoultella ornithinolytica]